MALATDTRGRMMFFSDHDKRIVHWARLIDGQSIQVVTHGVGSVEGKIVIIWKAIQVSYIFARIISVPPDSEQTFPVHPHHTYVLNKRTNK